MTLAALLAYPTVIELTLGTAAQSNAWFYGYIALIAMIAVTALITFRRTANCAYTTPAPPSPLVKQIVDSRGTTLSCPDWGFVVKVFHRLS